MHQGSSVNFIYACFNPRGTESVIRQRQPIVGSFANSHHGRQDGSVCLGNWNLKSKRWKLLSGKQLIFSNLFESV